MGIWVWILVMVGGVMCAPLEDLVKSLPGQPAVSFRQFAGYVTVDDVAGTALFYYFVEAEKNATNLPLVLWLNGGPGCSSIGGGAFTELGPFYPSGGPQNGLAINSHSWNKVANLLFVESPAGVGWSYSNSSAYSYDDERVANETLTFLLKWLHKFPEYKTRDLFLAGESYAGHYIPQLASLILRYNTHSRHLPREFKFNLKAITVGNPLLNYGLDTSATYSFLWSHGLISDTTFKGVSSSCDFSDGTFALELDLDETKQENETAGTCPFFVTAARNEVGSNINMYDVTLDVCPPPIIQQARRLRKRIKHRVKEEGIDVCIDGEITSYLNRQDVQQALHANTTALPYPWEACSRVVQYKFEDQLQDMIPAITSLIKQGLPVWIFSGDQDSVVPLTGTRTQIDKLAKDLKLKRIIQYSAWYAHGQVGGWTEVYEKLVYTTVRGASHMVPYAQPERALIMFQRFLAGKPLPRHSYAVKLH